MTTAYADASAIVKLIVEERESAALRRFVGSLDDVATSRIGLVEVRRAARRGGAPDELVDAVAESLGVIELDEAIAAAAGRLDPPGLRMLDALHLASALALSHVDALLVYDERLAEAARSIGLPVVTPG